MSSQVWEEMDCHVKGRDRSFDKLLLALLVERTEVRESRACWHQHVEVRMALLADMDVNVSIDDKTD